MQDIQCCRCILIPPFLPGDNEPQAKKSKSNKAASKPKESKPSKSKQKKSPSPPPESGDSDSSVDELVVGSETDKTASKPKESRPSKSKRRKAPSPSPRKGESEEEEESVVGSVSYSYFIPGTLSSVKQFTCRPCEGQIEVMSNGTCTYIMTFTLCFLACNTSDENLHETFIQFHNQSKLLICFTFGAI